MKSDPDRTSGCRRPARLLLRATAPSDAPAWSRVLASNAASLPWLGIGEWRLDSGRLADVLEAKAGREHGRCVTVLERSTGCVIGVAALLVPNPVDGIPWISVLALAADHQNLGLGTEAALGLEGLLARGGWSEVRLSVLTDNPRALRFWQRLGYRELAGAWRAYNGSPRGAITLAKTLTASGRACRDDAQRAAAELAQGNLTPGRRRRGAADMRPCGDR